MNSIALSRGNIAIPAHESVILTCYRNLIDSEIRSLTSEKKYQSGTFEMSAKAIKKNSEYSYGPISSMSIEGKVEGGQA